MKDCRTTRNQTNDELW